MRYSRQNKIIQLINEYEIDTQEKLVSLLREAGYDITQATISRDIKELQLVKTLTSSGKYKYSVSTSKDLPITDRFVKIFKQTITSYDCAKNIIILKTLAGCANAACEAMDNYHLEHVKGSLAGDNTFILIIDDDVNTPAVMKSLDRILGASDEDDE